MQEVNKLETRISVIGGGSWATALVKILTDNGYTQVFWWLRDPASVNFIKEYGHNPRYLSSVPVTLPAVNLGTDLKELLSTAELVILAIPAAFLQETLAGCDADDFKGKVVVSAIKGLIPDHNLVIAEFMHQRYELPFENFLVLTGPCHAEEVALEKLSYLTIASLSASKAAVFASMLENRYIKTCVSADIYGTEYSAALKNVIAIASGICHGLGYGDNFQAVLIANAIQEIRRFVDALHPQLRDINESAYLGDLLVTAYSQFSRNRTFGAMLGKGYSVRSAQLEMNMIAEGYYAARSLFQLNVQAATRMPILDAVYHILYEHTAPAMEIAELSALLS